MDGKYRSDRWVNRKLTEWPGRDVFSDGLPVMGCIQPDEIIPAAQKSQIEMHSAGRNNPCGTKDQARDASGWPKSSLWNKRAR